ncbi:MAG TPA: polyphosphate kinase 2 family protein [bacterium]|nr:polyphosphate kinase 2 family protein [bacterium]
MKRYFVKPGSRFRLDDADPSDTGDFEKNGRGEREACEKTQKILTTLDDFQERLYASAERSMLIVLQGMDTSGKDGMIKSVIGAFNQQGCRVSSFKVPTQEEKAHDFLWRVHHEVPPKGFIGVFNRSHYEDVLVTRVHKMIDDETAEKRFRQINDFERLLAQSGTVILKFFLHISKDEQRKRLQARADDPKKHWKFNINDVHERKYWGDYQKAFRDLIRETTTKHAPWTVVPANHKWYRDYVTAKIIAKTLEDMKLRYPPGPKGVDLRKIKIR